MRRQLLDPLAGRSVADVVRRLGGVQAQVASYAELCVRVRRTTSKPGDVARALSQGRIIKTWAMRGTLHLVTPEEAGVFLSLIAAGRSWEQPSWQQWFGITPKQLEALRVVVREALDGKVLTRNELAAAGTKYRGLVLYGTARLTGSGSPPRPLLIQCRACCASSAGRLC